MFILFKLIILACYQKGSTWRNAYRKMNTLEIKTLFLMVTLGSCFALLEKSQLAFAQKGTLLPVAGWEDTRPLIEGAKIAEQSVRNATLSHGGHILALIVIIFICILAPPRLLDRVDSKLLLKLSCSTESWHTRVKSPAFLLLSLSCHCKKMFTVRIGWQKRNVWVQH